MKINELSHHISQRALQAIEEKVSPGCVIGFSIEGKKTILPFGRFTYENDSEEVQQDSIYDIASVTKSIPTACSILTLIDQGKLSLDDRVVQYLPEFGDGRAKENVTIRHLLTYTLELEVPAMSSLKDRSADEVVNTVVQAPLKNKPGTTFLYTNSTAVFLGLIIHRITGKKLDEYAQESFFDPLHMKDTTFHPEDMPIDRIVPTEIDEWRGLVRGVPHDESTYVTREKYTLGVAGLFSTVPDLLTFQQMLLERGEYKERRFLSEKNIREIESNQTESIGVFNSLGWELNQPRYMGTYAEEIYGKTGFTGCVVLNNFKKRRAITILSNRTYPKRGSKDANNKFWGDIANIVFS